MGRDDSRLWCEQQNRLDLGYPDEIRVRQNITGAGEHVDPSRDFCNGKLNVQRLGIGFNLSLSSFCF